MEKILFSTPLIVMECWRVLKGTGSDNIFGFVLVALIRLLSHYSHSNNVGHCSVIWTKSMQRLYFLVERCYRVKEPVLLVGETGGGKTTVCQLLSLGLSAQNKESIKLLILNCHQYTETSDFLGVGCVFFLLFVFSYCIIFCKCFYFECKGGFFYRGFILLERDPG